MSSTPAPLDRLIDRLTHLKDAHGFKPEVVYDIGANTGHWTQSLLPLYPGSTFVQFEATEQCQMVLRSKAKQFKDVAHIDVRPPVVLADVEVKTVFYETSDNAMGTGNSLALEQTSAYDEDRRIERHVHTVSLDQYVATHSLPLPHLAKLDTQGSELMILRGAYRALLDKGSPCEVIIVETKVLPYNLGAPDMATMVAFMANRRWRFHDVTELHYLPTGELVEMDVLFVREGSSLVKLPPY
jgi:FkbM family methyltransferase